MTEFFAAFGELMLSTNPWVYAIIFFGKLTEVSVSTLRLVLINRGERVTGCILAVIEITLWLLVTSSVLAGFQSDPLKIVFYAAAFTLGIFMGSMLDEKLALGLSSIQIVLPDEESAALLCHALNKQGYGVTRLSGKGREGDDRSVLLMMIKRKSLKDALKLIDETCAKAVITVSDVKSQKGGYLRSSPARRSLIK